MNKIAVLFGIFAFFGMFTIFSNFAFASCAVNEDWSDAPCFDVLPVNREEYRVAWVPYYDYKGPEWMEQKRIEMFDAKEDGKLAEWMDEIRQNHKVFSYYQSLGEISFPPEYDRPFFEDDFRFYLQFFTQGWLFFVWIGVSAGLIAGAAAFIFRRRK
jgi:LPXTG-motif cell wall-anchored protein